MPVRCEKSRLFMAVFIEIWYELPALILSYGSMKLVRFMLAASVNVVATGHFNQSMVSRAVLIMLISLTSLLSAPVAISHPFNAVSPVKSSFEKLVSVGKVRVFSLGRLLSISAETDSKVVDDMDSTSSTSEICSVPVTASRPLSVMSSIPLPAIETFPVNVVHWLRVVTSSELLIAKVPEEGAQSVAA